jgi:hypothetical protein
MYEFFSFRFLTTEAMLPLLPCTARHCSIPLQHSVYTNVDSEENVITFASDKRFQQVDICHRKLEQNKTQDRRWKLRAQ